MGPAGWEGRAAVQAAGAAAGLPACVAHGGRCAGALRLCCAPTSMSTMLVFVT